MTQAQAAQAPGTQYTDFEPLGWPAGQTTTVTAYGSWTTPSLPVGCWGDWIQVQGLNADGSGGTGVPDPNVTISDTINYGLTQTTFTVTVAANAPYTKDLMNFGCLSGSCPEWSEIFVKPLICPFAPPTITSVSPDIWDAGQTYNVTITGTNFVPGTYLGGATAYPGCPATYMNITTSAGTLSYSYTFASATTITAVVTPAAGDPAATATIAVSGPPTATATAQIVPAPCPVPTVASISPNVWWAGQTYKNVTVTGTNFVTPAAATAACPATTATITGASFALGTVTVNSATQITIATVAPPSTEPTEGPTIAVSNEASPQPNVDVLGPPQIQCTGSSMQCDGETISGANASTQTVVVGQTITLSTTPTATTLAGLPVHVALSNTTPTTWTVGGTNIGARVFGPVNANGTPTSATAKATILTNPGLTTYWLFPNSKVPVTYVYCVGYSGVSSQCSAKATATFNVTGPTAQITTYQTFPTAYAYWTVSPPSGACETQWLIYGLLYTNTTNCPPPIETAGIVFAASNVNTTAVTAPNEVFQWVQIVNSDVTSGTESGTKVKPSSVGPGLDNFYPYPPVPDTANLETDDGPGTSLDNALTTETDTFNATMYLMWNSNLDSASIAVPIGYVKWSINGTASKNTKASPPWSIASQGSTSATYTASTDTGAPAHGLPTWTTVVLNTTGTKALNVQQDGEEEQ